MTEPIKLPPLPDPFVGLQHNSGWNSYEQVIYSAIGEPHVISVFTEGQMQAYATAAIKADRQANQITGETSDGYHTFNELYAHRVRLLCLLMHAHKDNAWWSRKHHDGSAWEGWVVAGIDTPEGTATYHLPESEIENLPEGTELPNGKEWDGHTAADVLVRLLSLRQARGEPIGECHPNVLEYGAGNCDMIYRVGYYQDGLGVKLYTAPQPQQIPEDFLRSVINLCSHHGALPDIQCFDPEDKWIADLWRKAEAMLEAAPEPEGSDHG